MGPETMSALTGLSEQDRLLPIDHGFNFRDFGGYATAHGGWVKPGMLYRAGVMAFVEGDGRERLRERGILSICDLRTSRERRHRPTRWHEGLAVELWARDYGESKADLISQIEEGNTDAAQMRATMTNLYRALPYVHAESYRALFGLLLAGKAPLVVNCSAGKDRTGVAVALVLSALDVPRETILADYVLTSRADFSGLLAMTRRADAPPLPAEVMEPLLAADPVYLNTMFETLDTRSGGVNAYLQAELGVDDGQLARLRDLLIDGC